MSAGEMVERIARVLCSLDHQDPDEILRDGWDRDFPRWQQYAVRASAAISEIERTHEIIERQSKP